MLKSTQKSHRKQPHGGDKFYKTFEYSEDQEFESDLEVNTEIWNPLNAVLIGVALAVVVICSISLSSTSNSSTTTISSTSQSSSNEQSTASIKPNFVFILADDVGWNALGYENFDLSFATPNLTKMAKNGVILSNYYSQESCSPARSALLTGRYPISTGMQYGSVEPTYEYGLNSEETLLPEVLRDSGGYKNYILGKWNLGHYNPKYLPTARGFDYFLGFLDGHNYYWSKRDPSCSTYWDFMYSDSVCYDLYDGADRETYSTTLYGQKAVDAITSHDFASNPLFMYLAVQAAHDPFSDLDTQYADGITEKYVGTERYETGI